MIKLWESGECAPSILGSCARNSSYMFLYWRQNSAPQFDSRLGTDLQSHLHHLPLSRSCHPCLKNCDTSDTGCPSRITDLNRSNRDFQSSVRLWKQKSVQLCFHRIEIIVVQGGHHHVWHLDDQRRTESEILWDEGSDRSKFATFCFPCLFRCFPVASCNYIAKGAKALPLFRFQCMPETFANQKKYRKAHHNSPSLSASLRCFSCSFCNLSCSCSAET